MSADERGARMLEVPNWPNFKEIPFFGTISHFLAPFEVLTPTSILNFAALFFTGLRAELWAQTQKKRDGNSGFDFLDF